MKKEQFLRELTASLKQFPKEETQDLLNYYNEIISDEIESGKDEEEVVKSLGSIKTISARIQTDLIDVRLKQPENIVKTSNSFFIILTICLLSPALFPLGIAFFAAFFSVLITWGVLVISFGAASVGIIISIIPVTVSAFGQLGIGGVLLIDGVLLVLFSLFAILTLMMFQTGIWVLTAMVRTVGKIINKLTKRGKGQ